MEKGKEGLLLKTLARCRSLGYQRRSTKKRVAPEGYFTVCVGANKDRFRIRTECANHPLFRLLLDDAETEYGFSREGPLELPCGVNLFHRVLWEMEQDRLDAPWCGFAAPPIRRVGKGHSGYRILSPSRLMLTG